MRRDRGLDQAVDGTGLTPAFQPIVDLDSGNTVGLEALARWTSPAGIGPDEVLTYAAALGRTAQLDQRCAHAGITAALESDIARGTLITVNYEPATPYPGVLDGKMLARAAAELTLAFELTERGLLRHPHSVLSTVDTMRADGFLIALDDVGAHPDSLALLDVVRPDIIKLDMGLVQQQSRTVQARTIARYWPITNGRRHPSWPRVSRPTYIWSTPGRLAPASGRALSTAMPARSPGSRRCHRVRCYRPRDDALWRRHRSTWPIAARYVVA